MCAFIYLYPFTYLILTDECHAAVRLFTFKLPQEQNKTPTVALGLQVPASTLASLHLQRLFVLIHQGGTRSPGPYSMYGKNPLHLEPEASMLIGAQATKQRTTQFVLGLGLTLPTAYVAEATLEPSWVQVPNMSEAPFFQHEGALKSRLWLSVFIKGTWDQLRELRNPCDCILPG